VRVGKIFAIVLVVIVVIAILAAAHHSHPNHQLLPNDSAETTQCKGMVIMNNWNAQQYQQCLRTENGRITPPASFTCSVRCSPAARLLPRT
jgi:hypothetical protein